MTIEGVVTGPGASRKAAGPSRSAPDRLTVILFSFALFMIMLALLATQLRAAAVPHRTARAVLLRKIYRTTVVETIVGESAASGTSVSRSVSSSGSLAPAPVAATTRTS